MEKQKMSFSGGSKKEYEIISKELKLKNKKILLEINFFKGSGNAVWAKHVLNLVSAALPLLEDASGTPYNRAYGVKIYEASAKDTGRNDGENREEEGIWIKPCAFDSYIVHEAAHCFTDLSDESWIIEGLAELYTYTALKDLGKQDSGNIKGNAFLEYSKFLKLDDDFPLDGWDPMTAQKSKAYFGYSKSFIFFYMIQKKYGLEIIKSANKILCEKKTKATSTDYKNALEESSGIKMDDLFAGWVFPGENTVFFDEIPEIEKFKGSSLERKILKKIFERF